MPAAAFRPTLITPRLRFALAAAIGAMTLFTPVSLAEPPETARGLTVEDAYRAIPQRQTPYRADRASAAPPERAWLAEALALTDQAAAVRVDAMRWLQSGARRGVDPIASEQALEALRQRLTALTPPSRLRTAHRGLLDALFQLRQTVASWQAATEDDLRVNMKMASVQQMHRSLDRVYAKLLALYPRESEYVRQAFHDHLAALDFVSLQTRQTPTGAGF